MTKPGDTIAKSKKTQGGILVTATVTIYEAHGDLLITLGGGAAGTDTYGPSSPTPMRRADWEKAISGGWVATPAPMWWGGERMPTIRPQGLLSLAGQDIELRALIAETFGVEDDF